MLYYFFDEGYFTYIDTNAEVGLGTSYPNKKLIVGNATYFNETIASSVATGATVEGDMSYKKFSRGNIKVKSNPVILELKIMGLNE